MAHPFPHHKEEARLWAQDLLGRSDWVILDTETTGLDGRAEVVQIGVLRPDAAPLLNALVRPKGRIPIEATAIHGITEEMVAGAPGYPEIHAALHEILPGRLVVCYNAEYDRRILRQTAERHGLSDVPVEWDCAMQQYSRFRGQWSHRHGNYTWPKLPPSRRFGHLQHQALGDCYATLELIHAMAGHDLIFCDHCGVKLIPHHPFCWNCGATR